jgi:hypothetical protein
MNPRPLLLSFAALAALAGCGKKSTDDHAGHNHDHGDHSHGEKKSAPETTFKAGTGLTIPLVTRVALGFTTAPAEERALPSTLRVTAQVFQPGPPPLASATVPAVQAATLAGKALSGARLVSLKPHSSAPDTPVDLVLALDDRPGAKLGDFVDLTLTAAASAPVVSIPRSALLRSASGTFVYVVNGGAYLRTAVTPGASSADFIEIADGLYAGDEVVTHPVEQLWLIELRATKGGGHSH